MTRKKYDYHFVRRLLFYTTIWLIAGTIPRFFNLVTVLPQWVEPLKLIDFIFFVVFCFGILLTLGLIIWNARTQQLIDQQTDLDEANGD